MAKKEKNVASESESEDESDDDEFNQHLACLSKKDKLMVLKLRENSRARRNTSRPRRVSHQQDQMLGEFDQKT
jgi:hypothetical protein